MIDFNTLLEKEKKSKGYGPNSEQLEVIFSDKNTIVSAGAGSGKTTVLSYRFLRLVLEGKAKVDEILTLTFTRKAAAEMHTRILKQLLKYKDEKIVADQLELFSSAAISTLDSFCSQIVRADCLRYGIARDFSITSETLEGEESALQIANEMLEEEKYRAPLSILAKKLSLPDLYSSFFLPLSRMCSIITKLDVDETVSKLKEALISKQEQNYEKVLEINSYLENEYVDSLSDKAQAYFLENKTVFLNKDLASPLHGLNKIVVRNKPFGEDYKEQFNEQKALWFDYKNIAFALEHLPEEEVLLHLVNDYILRLQKNKREKGELSFTDVAELAVEILKTNKGLRKYFKEKFKYIMIDEFQDNNALQKELLYLLGEADDKELDGEITSADLNKNKLFFVGDEKQSIYRFRGADVSVFKALSEEIRCTDGNVLTLSANYRSEPLIIEHVNAVFRKLFKGEKAYEASSQDALTKYDIEGIERPKTKGEDASVNLFILAKDEEKKEDEIELLLDNESEAYFVADKIEEIVKSGKYKVRGGKAPTWSDIAILLRTGSNQMCFEKALLAKGIPYSVEESRSLMLEAIASDLYSALQYLLYPEDMSAYIAILRSPFVRLKDSSIYTLRTKGETELTEKERAKLAQFESHMEQAQELLRAGALTSLLDYLYYNTGYYAYILSNPKYHAYLENYDTLWALARDYEAEGYSATAFLSYLRDNMATTNKLNSTPGWKESVDAVKILTIHKSKGLEYPVVFISNAGAGIAPNRAGFAFKTDFGICTNLPDANFSALLGDDDSEKDRAEMLRLLYVAATRAMGHLFITGKLKLKKDGSLGKTAISTLLGQYLIGLGEYDEEGNELGGSIIPIGTYPALTTEDIERADTKGDKESLAKFVTNLSDKAFRPTTQKVNASALEVEDIDITDSISLPPLKCDEILIKNNLITEFGTYCHLLCEYAVKGLNWEVQSFNKGALKEKEVECINECGRSLVRTLMENEYFKSLLKLGRPECEVRFFMPFEDSLLEGVADLVIVAKDHCLVLDYKTDKEIIKDNHKAQVLAYLKAVSELYGGKKTYGSLIYLRDIKKEVIWDMDGNEVDLF